MFQEYRGVGPPVQTADAGMRLDRYLGLKFPFRSRQQWKEQCELRKVRINQQCAKASTMLRHGDVIDVYHPQTDEPEVDINLKLLCERSGIMAIAKPANLPMHESGLYRRNTFVTLLRCNFGREWSPVHRLDRETSGVVICAATAGLRQQLSTMFATKEVTKTYYGSWMAALHGVINALMLD